MTAPLRLALVALLSVSACSDEDAIETQVRARFAAFESAFRAADADALCGLVTRESLPAVEQLPRAEVERRPALLVDGVARRTASRFDVSVREASGERASGVFVMQREDGAWRVDLVESAAATNGVSEGPETVEPAGLTAEQIDGIRANHRAELK